MEGVSKEGAPTAEWSPSPFWTGVGSFAGKSYVTLLMICFGVCALAAAGSNVVLLAIPTLAIAGPLSIAVHEMGHYLAARRAGMTVLLVRIAAIDIAPQRKGWKVRWKRHIHRMPAGYVSAAPDPDLPLRKGMIRYALGGPFASVVFAALVALAIPCLPTPAQRWAFGAAVSWLLIPSATVFPRRNKSSHLAIESDGATAWRWWKHPPGEGWTASLMATSRMIHGTPLSGLDEKDRAVLLDDSLPGVWYTVKWHQQRGDWALAAGLGNRLESLVPKDPYSRSPFSELVDISRGEIAFARAIAQDDAAQLPDAEAIRRARWANAPLAARCAAWRAHRTGDLDAWRRELEAGFTVAGNSPDRSLLASERLIAARLYGEASLSP